jgi:hypothetical protein
MTLATIAREAADIAADNTQCPLTARLAYPGCLVGIGMSNSGFADKQCRGVVAQAQARRVLDGERTIGGHCTRFDLKVTVQRVRDGLGPRQGTYRRAAYTHHGPARRLPIEHRVEIDDTMHVGKRHTQRAAHFCRNRFGKPATDLLSSVQGWQERAATLRRQLGKNRAQGNEFAIGHLVFQAPVSFRLYRRPFLNIKRCGSMAMLPYLRAVFKPSFKVHELGAGYDSPTQNKLSNFILGAIVPLAPTVQSYPVSRLYTIRQSSKKTGQKTVKIS